MTTSQHFRIVAAVDLDTTAGPTWATATALLANPHAEVSLVHVVRAGEREVRKDSAETEAMVGEAHRRVQEILARELGDPSNPLRERIDVYVGVGDPAAEILQLAVDLEASLIVVGTHERTGLERLVLGSVSSEVFRKATCSVLVARPADHSGKEKSPAIAAPLAAGQASMVRAHPVIRYRSTPFAKYDANLVPTGIPRKQVR